MQYPYGHAHHQRRVVPTSPLFRSRTSRSMPAHLPPMTPVGKPPIAPILGAD